MSKKLKDILIEVAALIAAILAFPLIIKWCLKYFEWVLFK